jgi:hypothetical protein
MNKLITFYSDTHEYMYKKYFIESFNKYLCKKYTLHAKKTEQICETGYFQSKGFDLAMLEKINIILENININDKNLLVYADCDVQFFGDLEFDMTDKDILFQHDYYSEHYCAGFFICKQNLQILNFFKEVQDNLKRTMNGLRHDQDVINEILKYDYCSIKKGMLPDNKYWTVANSTNGNIWSGQEINVPNEIIMHHANFTIGVENKIKLLELVKNKKNGLRN